MVEKLPDFYVSFFDRMPTVAAGQIDLLRIADDIGTIGPATIAVTGTGTCTMNGSGGIHLGGMQTFP